MAAQKKIREEAFRKCRSRESEMKEDRREEERSNGAIQWSKLKAQAEGVRRLEETGERGDGGRRKMKRGKDEKFEWTCPVQTFKLASGQERCEVRQYPAQHRVLQMRGRSDVMVCNGSG